MKSLIDFLKMALYLAIIGVVLPANAEVILDGIVGPAGQVPGPDYQITADMGQISGNNLFHSFDSFTVNTNESAMFSGPGNIENIIGRVTGANATYIDGTLGCSIDQANLYLFNQNGIGFGPNARLDIKGSFHFSTADYLMLSDSSRFYADPAQPSLLQSASPQAFGFLGNDVSNIDLKESYLQVPDGKTISAVGGDITLDNATLYAPSGQINLISVKSAGQVDLTNSAAIKLDDFAALGTISLSHLSNLRYYFENPMYPDNLQWIGDVDTSGSSTGNIVIRGGKLICTSAEIFSDTFGSNTPKSNIDIATQTLSLSQQARISASSQGSSDGGDIAIESATVKINGSPDDTKTTGIFCESFGSGNSGDITLTTQALELTQSGRISTSTANAGQGGNLNILADTISISGSLDLEGYTYFSGLFSETLDQAEGGNINVSTQTLAIDNQGKISTSSKGSGDCGKIDIKAEEITVRGKDGDPFDSGIFGESRSSGNGDDITITAGSLNLFEGGRVSSSTFESGQGGNINLDVDAINIDGLCESPDQVYSSGLFNETYGQGNTGDIVITGNQTLSIQNQGQISASSEGTGKGGAIQIDSNQIALTGKDNSLNYTGILCDAHDVGNAGSIDIRTTRLDVMDGAKISSSTQGTGLGGNLKIDADTIYFYGHMRVDDFLYFSGLYSETVTDANAGNMNIDTQNLIIESQGRISSSTNGSGQGGNMNIQAQTIAITGKDGDLFDTAIFSEALADGNAGTISITADKIELTRGGRVSASTTGIGKGGDILLTARAIDIDGVLDSQYDTYSSGIFSETLNQGDTGDISITGNQTLSIQNNGRISASSKSSGNSGTIKIDSDQILIAGQNDNITYTGIFCEAKDTGNAGNIDIDTSQLQVLSGGRISTTTLGSGLGGHLNISADNIRLSGHMQTDDYLYFSGFYSETVTPANAGTIGIDTRTLDIDSQARISSSSNGSGKGGDVVIKAGTISIMSKPGDLYDSAIFSEALADGDAGNIIMDVDRLSLTNGGRISTSSFEKGTGGNLAITGHLIQIDGLYESLNGTYYSGLFSETLGQGNAGNIDIIADDIYLTGRGLISSTSSDLGNAGNISLGLTGSLLCNGGIVSALSSESSGGNIKCNVAEIVNLYDSVITTRVFGNQETVGGDLQILSKYLILNDGLVSAQAEYGFGGNIKIKADTYLSDFTSLVSASSNLGIDGTVDIQSGVINLSGILIPLSKEFLPATGLLADECIAKLRAEKKSSFIIQPRDGMPEIPDKSFINPIQTIELLHETD